MCKVIPAGIPFHLSSEVSLLFVFVVHIMTLLVSFEFSPLLTLAIVWVKHRLHDTRLYHQEIFH